MVVRPQAFRRERVRFIIGDSELVRMTGHVGSPFLFEVG